MANALLTIISDIPLRTPCGVFYSILKGLIISLYGLQTVPSISKGKNCTSARWVCMVYLVAINYLYVIVVHTGRAEAAIKVRY